MTTNLNFGYSLKRRRTDDYDPNSNSDSFPLDLEHYLTDIIWSGHVEKCEEKMENSGVEASFACTPWTVRSLRGYATLQAQDS